MPRITQTTLRLGVFLAALAIAMGVLSLVHSGASDPQPPAFAAGRDIPKGDVDCYQWPRGTDIALYLKALTGLGGVPTDCETFYSSTLPASMIHPTAYAPSYWFATTAPGEPIPDHLDMNCDGAADLQDVLIILRHIAGVPTTLPAGCEELAPEPDIF